MQQIITELRNHASLLISGVQPANTCTSTQGGGRCRQCGGWSLCAKRRYHGYACLLVGRDFDLGGGRNDAFAVEGAHQARMAKLRPPLTPAPHPMLSPYRLKVLSTGRARGQRRRRLVHGGRGRLRRGESRRPFRANVILSTERRGPVFFSKSGR